ncbi:MAG: FG-GAP-like repeat-containing protein [Cyclobacteriaceae bacterium]
MSSFIRRFIAFLFALNVFQNAFSQGFTEIALQSGINHYGYDSDYLAGTGLAFVDIDGDGDEDLYLVGGLHSDVLLVNDGTGKFEDVSVEAGLAFTANIPTNGVIAGDIDKDGDRDLCITTGDGHSNILLLNNGNKTFTNIAESAGLTSKYWSMGASFGDYNQDGLIDLFIGNYIINTGNESRVIKGGALRNQLYKNLGNNKFEDVSNQFPFVEESATLVTAFTDVDGDRNLDIFVGNDFGPTYGANNLYQYDFEEGYVNIAKSANTDKEVYAMGIGNGDYDKDGDLDYYVTNDGPNLFHTKRHTAIRYDDQAAKLEVALPGYTSWGTVFFDYNNDSHLDLAVANGAYLSGLFQPTFLFQGNSEGTFEDVSIDQNVVHHTSGRGLVTADIDNDGDLDFAVSANYNQSQSDGIHTLLYRNDNINTNNWFKVKLEGFQSNKDGLGAWVTVVANGETLVREISGGGASYLSHNSIVAHFGLAGSQTTDSLTVDWIGGSKQVFTGIPANQMVLIKENQPSNKTITLTICEFDSVLHNGRYIQEAGSYYDTIRNELYDLHQIVETKLSIKEVEKDTIWEFVRQGELFDGHTILTDTTIIKRQVSSTSCPKAIIYQIKTGTLVDIDPGDSPEIAKIYPKPAAGDYLNLIGDFGNRMQLKLKMYDTSGKLMPIINYKFLGSNKARLYIGNMNPGLYYLKVIAGDKNSTLSLLKR